MFNVVLAAASSWNELNKLVPITIYYNGYSLDFSGNSFSVSEELYYEIR